ncbi:hypothetical protein GCM10027562_20120 [Arthrobacter pigmenti]
MDASTSRAASRGWRQIRRVAERVDALDSAWKHSSGGSPLKNFLPVFLFHIPAAGNTSMLGPSRLSTGYDWGNRTRVRAFSVSGFASCA